MFKKASEQDVVSWIQKDQINLLGKYLLSGSVHGKPGVPASEIDRVKKIISKNFDQEEIYNLSKKLIQRKEYSAKSLGAHLIESGWPKHKDVEKFITLALEDENWMVREYAAEGLAQLLAKDFSFFSKRFKTWVKKSSVNVKRAVALAIKYDANSKDQKKIKTYFDILTPLLEEEDEYIRKNLGPFAIGDGLFSRFPKETLALCKKWAESEDRNVKWNTAMIFTAAAARPFKKEGMEILKLLKNDPDPFVMKAAEKAERNLAK